jgi:oxygen-independent coproporphyrinogen-3 oxidase
MAGIYFHIPFCKTRCLYCDFFSSTNPAEKEAYIEAMCQELHDRKDYLKGQTVETIYFGGGTPSQLSAKHFEKIFDALNRVPCTVYRVPIEITLEANPDDITPEYLDSIRHLPFNRISLGVQSFNDDELLFLNRRHDAQSAIRAVKLCQEKGFDNISIDLMYGLPRQTPDSWERSIRQAIDLDIQHLSAYHLIYEEGTALFRLVEQGQIHPVDEDMSVRLFESLIDRMTGAGLEQYEISNFAKPGCHSRHNAAYWDGTHYLGIGAAAHSYNGVSRQWNKPATGAGYREQGFEVELLDEKAMFNDFIITRLRTMKGIDLNELQSLFGEKKKDYGLKQAQPFIHNQLLEIVNEHLRLTRQGIFVSDGVMRELMI